MNKKERILNAIQGKKTDKIPFSFWTHFPGDDLNPSLLAEKTYAFYKEYDIDFIKTMNSGMYSIEDFDCDIDYSEIPKGGIAKLVSSPIKNYEDWDKILETNVLQGALGRELNHLKSLKSLVGEDAPIIFTVFSPLTTASKISNGLILKHIEEGTFDEIHYALSNITASTKKLIEEAINIGIDGIFLASQLSSYDKTTEDVYLKFGVKYDLDVLKSANSLAFNALHLHGENIMFDLVKDYPVDAFNWHIGETLPEIGEASLLTNKCIMGGLNRMDITNQKKNPIINQIYNAFKLTQGKKIILTPGCGLRHPINKDFLIFLRNQKNHIEKLLNI